MPTKLLLSLLLGSVNRRPLLLLRLLLLRSDPPTSLGINLWFATLVNNQDILLRNALVPALIRLRVLLPDLVLLLLLLLLRLRRSKI